MPDQMNSHLTHLHVAVERRLTAEEFQQLTSVPAAAEWFANIDNSRTRRAYQNDLADFCGYVGLTGAEEFRSVTRAHVLAWRAQLENRAWPVPQSAVNSQRWPACSITS